MDKSIHFDDILKLGRKIVDEYELDQTVDTLGRWMAHYIAEKMIDAENADDQSRNQKMSECRDAILTFWAHRNQLQNGKRPFEGFEPVYNALQKLDVENDTPRLFSHMIQSALDDKKSNNESKRWIKLAMSIDDSAKLLICYCLTKAAQEAIDKTKEWVALAESLECDDLDIKTLIQLRQHSETLQSESPNDFEKKKIENLLQKLDEFTQCVNVLSTSLRQKLD